MAPGNPWVNEATWPNGPSVIGVRDGSATVAVTGSPRVPCEIIPNGSSNPWLDIENPPLSVTSTAHPPPVTYSTNAVCSAADSGDTPVVLLKIDEMTTASAEIRPAVVNASRGTKPTPGNAFSVDARAVA